MKQDHAYVLDRLDHFLDGELPIQERLAVQEHLGRCDDCLEEMEVVREIRDAAQLLPREIAPPRDLWPAIAARIHATSPEQDRAVIQVDFSPRPQARRAGVWVIRIAAALALVVASSSVTVLLLRQPGTEPVAVMPTNTARAPAKTALAAFAPTEVEYQGAVNALHAELRQSRGRLSPETMATVEANLRIIDAAIAESRAALAADPSNARLPMLLSGVYQKKVELLQHAVQISART
ncbi:MAG: zf-HC2 domain-containing protein [Gemmatimonadetes bacterium]|nr:zf-HC2 domain-containing protein [Gemmatimonadota bacterium]